MRMKLMLTIIALGLSIVPSLIVADDDAPWPWLAPYFEPPAEFAGQLGQYRSPLKFYDGTPVKDAADWGRRRQEILDRWNGLLGKWPTVIERPRLDRLESTRRNNFTQHRIRVEVAAGQMLDGYLLIPDGQGPFPAVVVPYYEPETSIGTKGELRDFGLQLSRRGFVTLAIGSPGGDARLPDTAETRLQPLSYLGYVAANCCNALAILPEVDPKRIGIVGHSYGGKWAMFGSCLYDKFACAAWSDGGIVFDESRGNVNYWEPWYLGLGEGPKRKPGLITPENPRTGPYAQLIEQGLDLHELHALMAPRPFLVSGGSEDFPARWVPLNHSIAVNQLLGVANRVGMTNRPTHTPTEASNEQIYSFFEHFLKPVKGLAQKVSEPAIKLVQPVDQAMVYKPTALPDRIVLTWTGDPTTTQAVTWRTSTEVVRGIAEIVLADPGPKLAENARQVVAVTQSLETDLNVAHFHTVNFKGLTPSAKHAYRVGDGVNWSEWFHFIMASTKPEPFSFIYFGDAQNDLRSMWSRVIREAYGDAPKAKFMIHAGDLINKAEADAEWGAWFGAGAWLNAMVPSVPVVGNHEMVKVDLLTHRLSHHWRPQFALPENGPKGLEETCLTFVYQGVRIIGMNSNEKVMEQAEWLDQVLTENKESWVICTFHHPMFSTGVNRDNAGLRAIWKPVLDKHRVDLVLQGHDHTYGRTGLDTPAVQTDTTTGVNASDIFSGTVYVVSVSGPKMYDLQRHPFMVRQAENTQLYQIIRMDGDQLHYEAYTAVGELYDAFTLHKQPGGINTLTDRIPDTPERLRPPVVEPPAKKASAALR